MGKLEKAYQYTDIELSVWYFWCIGILLNNPIDKSGSEKYQVQTSTRGSSL